MQDYGPYPSKFGVENHGIKNANTVYWHLTTPMLYEQAVRRREADIMHLGPLVVRTGDHTGRSADDKFIVKEPTTENDIWWGSVNVSISQEQFDDLYRRIRAYLQNRDIFVFDGYAGADDRYRMPVRIITEYAWHSLFARNMFKREFEAEKLVDFVPDFTVIDMPNFRADPQYDGTNSQTFIVVDFGKRLVLIGGTAYAGEIKKSIFTALNYYLPKRGVLSMHCSANYGSNPDDVALFFGLSGTGKTTLSNDTERILIGDDEHGWSDKGVFNFEGGCYAKVIRLDPEGEPLIYDTTRLFGTILENVAYYPDSRRVDLDDGSLTENTRASYPITHMANADRKGVAGHPKNIIFLTADAFGVMPPIARLSKEQAMYHFLSGYTAKVAGTERGVKDPQATLRDKIEQHNCDVWLVNTGWTGGPFGTGDRMKLAYTRRMVTAALTGELADVDTYTDPLFGLHIPVTIVGVPDVVLRPRETWSNGAEYDIQASKLAAMFADNFEQFNDRVSEGVRKAGPAN